MQFISGTEKKNLIEQNFLTIVNTYSNDCKLQANSKMSIIRLIQGSGQIFIGGKLVPCVESEVFIIPSNVQYNFFVNKSGESLLIHNICFYIEDWFENEIVKEDSENYCFGIFSEGNNVAYAKLTNKTNALINQYSDAIKKELEDFKFNNKYVIKSYLSLILVTISRYISDYEFSSHSSQVREKRIVDIIQNEIEKRYGDSDLTLSTFAKEFYVSISYLSKAIKNYTGQMFSDYIREFRMKKACEFLVNTELSVNEIISLCGLRDIPTFYRSFTNFTGSTPNQYRKNNSIKNKIEEVDSKTGILQEISTNVELGKVKVVKELVQKAIDEQINPKVILDDGLLFGMNKVGEKFKNNVVYIPEVLVSARALNQGTQLLKPYFNESGLKSIGKVCIGTVEGDLHDIGKNLVKMMMEGKQLEVIDLGTDVPAEVFIKTAIEQKCQIICCSALLSTTTHVMKEVVDRAVEAGIRDKIGIMIGGAPVSEEFCKSIGADVYTSDAASAAETAVELCKVYKNL